MHKNKKALWPLIILSLLTWGMVVAMIFFVEPILIKDLLIPDSYILFFGLMFLAVFFGLTLISRSVYRGLLTAFGVTLFLWLRVLRLGNVVNALLLLALILIIDFYIRSR